MANSKHLGVMKNMILELKPKSGLLSGLQSDTIYGHFCWRLKEKLGEQKLSDFISLYHHGKIVFLASDGFLKSDDQIYFPVPFLFHKPEMKDGKREKILEFMKRKNDKENKYISLNQLNQFISTGKYSVTASSVNQPIAQLHKEAKPLIEETLRVSVQIDRNNFTNAEGKLYSYNPKYLREDLTYIILIKVIDENLFAEYDCAKILKDVFEIGFGKKKSSGYGQFEVIRFESFDGLKENSNGDAVLVLGNYLPSPDDQCAPVGYNIITKYGKFGEVKSQSVNPFKNPIIFFTAGSCFKTNSTAKHYFGRVTDPQEISDYHPETVQFGCPFFLRFNYKTE